MQLGDRIPIGNTALGQLLLPSDIGKRGKDNTCRDGYPPGSTSAAEAEPRVVSPASGVASCEGGSGGTAHPPSAPCSERGEEPHPFRTTLVCYSITMIRIGIVRCT